MSIRADYNLKDGLTLFIGEHRLALNCEDNRTYSQPSPVELLIASMAACVASSGRQFLHRAGLDEGLKVECTFDMSEAHPDHIASIRFSIMVPSGIPTGLRGALEGVLNHCAVHNPLRPAPTVEVAIRERPTTDRGATRLVQSANGS